MMKKLFPYILIVLIVVQLLAPFTVGVGTKNNLEVKSNKAEAVGYDWYFLVTKSGIETPEEKRSLLSENNNDDITTKTACENARLASLRTDTTNGTKTGDRCFQVPPSTTVTTTGTTLDSNGAAVIPPPKDTSSLPSCGVAGWGGTIPGCVAQIFYYVLFIPTSYVFALAGTFFDFTFHYSIQSSSYSTPFVVEGWGIVRDFCNMFFIFILLYIAFGTILNLNGVKTKEMIISVVIIGLLINFSLFATQVIIDTSNILARVFYNSDAIRITQGTNAANGVTNATPALKIGPNGEIPLSAAIVNKVNPQNLIINGSKSVVIQDKFTGENGTASDKTGNIGAGAFILITLLAVAVNVVGIITFLSIGLIFVSRVIGLWMAMILSPFVFFSYTVPAMQEWEMVGWKKWWPETIKMAFLAPVFIFFMYIIISFLNKGLSLVSSNQGTTGLTFVISIIVPFIFIMVLLMKAKDIAKKMSGTMGQSITNGIAAVGGVALGGAALGAATLGRSTIGAFMKGASTGDTAAQRLRAGDPTLSAGGRLKGRLQQLSGIDWAQRQVGERLRANQHDIQHATHSRSELDTVAGTIAHGKKWAELNGEEMYQARRKLARDRAVRENGGAGTAGGVIAGGLGTRKWEAMSEIERNLIDTSIGVETVGPHTGKATAGGIMDRRATWDDTHTIQDARRKIGLGENIIQSTIGGSFDVRNLSKLIAGEQDRGINKFATGLTSALASGMRGVIKQTNINYGTGQKDFIKDLGHTITEALKSTPLKVDLSHVGEEKKEGQTEGHH